MRECRCRDDPHRRKYYRGVRAVNPLRQLAFPSPPVDVLPETLELRRAWHAAAALPYDAPDRLDAIRAAWSAWHAHIERLWSQDRRGSD